MFGFVEVGVAARDCADLGEDPHRRGEKFLEEDGDLGTDVCGPGRYGSQGGGDLAGKGEFEVVGECRVGW